MLYFNNSRINSVEKDGPETNKDLVLEIDNKLMRYDESASQKLREAENEQKNDQDIANPQYFHLMLMKGGQSADFLPVQD